MPRRAKRTLKQRLKRCLIMVGSLYLGIVIVLTLLETSMIYPAPGVEIGDWQPSWLKYEDANFETAYGNRLHGWFCEHPQPRAVVLLCHGNGEHVASMAEELEFLRERLRISVMAFDYRGYGKSPGKPFEVGVLADGEAARDWLSKRTGVPPESIVLWGRSLGGAVAVHLASQGGARGLILDRTFSSMVDVASDRFPWLPVRWLLSNRYPSVDRIQRYTGPLLQIHGQPDEVIPFRFGRKLFEAAPSEEKHFVASDQLTHNTPWPEEFYQRTDQFLDAL